MPHEYGVHGRGGHAQQRAEAARPAFELGTQGADPRFEVSRCLTWQPVSAATVVQPGVALGAPAGQPCVSGRSGDAEVFANVRDRAAVNHDTLD